MIETRKHSILSTTLTAGLGGMAGRMAGGFLAKSIEQIRAENPKWTEEQVRMEHKRLLEKAKRYSSAYGFALGTGNDILTSAAVGGVVGRFTMGSEDKFYERLKALDPTMTRRRASLLYEKEKEDREAAAALIAGAGALVAKHGSNKYKQYKAEQEAKKNPQPVQEPKKKGWFSKMFASYLGAGAGAIGGRWLGGKMSQSLESIRSEHPTWSEEEVRAEQKRLKKKFKSRGMAYGAAIGSKSRTLGGAALGGVIGRIPFKSKENFIESRMALNPKLTRREAELMWERNQDRNEQRGAAIGAALGFVGGRAYDAFKKKK